ncbi:hypothetical protein LO749_21770 (plasmid) [Paracoccus denitrificans]|uniref:hypothetical protein n=1 Tax=Paracoccus denitrificans TaxID=266 RepID=UPI001E48DA01|nr:hypothetical protein [Paracoccus denitrificans]UFS68265.1 hypothetical protein LO749_21770 [Paracoccus denitrificans]
MTTRTHSPIDPGSPAYWRDRQRAFRLIRDADLALKRQAEAPMYLHGGYDEDGDVIAIENLEPHDDLEAAIRAIEADATAVSILAAQGRSRIGGYAIGAVIRELDGTARFAEDPARNPLWGPDTD